MVFLLLSGIVFGLIILSHIVVALFLFPVILVNLLFAFKKLSKSLIYSTFLILVSLLISMFHWAAPLIYKPYLFTTTYPGNSLPYFPTLIELLYSPWRFGLLFQGPRGELSFLIGYVQLFIIIATLYLLLNKKIPKKYYSLCKFWLITIFVLIFLITPYSKLLWENMYLIKGVGSHRLLILVGFSISILAGFLSLIIKKKTIIYVLIGTAILSTILNWGHRRLIPEINDNILKRDISQGTRWGDTHFYALPKWVDPKQPWFADVPKYHLEILQGKATIVNTYRSSTKHVYEINAQTKVNLKENTLYFPGWSAKINGQPVALWPDSNGIINLISKTGRQKLEVTYNDLPLYTLTKSLSIISFFISFLYIFYWLVKKLVKTRSL